MSKLKKTLLTTLCTGIAAGMIAFGCSPQRLEEAKKPKIEYPGMPVYNTDSEWPDYDVFDYVFKLSKNTPSAKKGLPNKIQMYGELISLETFYQHGVPKNAKPDKDGFYTSEVVSMIQNKVFRHLDPKEMSSTPMFTKHGKLTIIEYDDKLDRKIDFRIIIHEKWIEGKGIVKTQELDLGADGTIEERLITLSYDDYNYTFETSDAYIVEKVTK